MFAQAGIRFLIPVHPSAVMSVITRNRVDTPVHIDTEFGITKPLGTLIVRRNRGIGRLYWSWRDVEFESCCAWVDKGVLTEVIMLCLDSKGVA